MNVGKRIYDGALIVEACFFCGALKYWDCDGHVFQTEGSKMEFMEPSRAINLRKNRLEELNKEIERTKADIEALENLTKEEGSCQK